MKGKTIKLQKVTYTKRNICDLLEAKIFLNRKENASNHYKEQTYVGYIKVIISVH